MGNIALVMPGQGAQYVGMGKKLYENFPVVRQLFEEANDSLNFDIRKLCFEGNMDELTKTENAQPAILTVSVAAFKAYMQEIGIEPQYMAGHSLGEYSALVCSGAMRFSDAVKIVRSRGRFMQEAAALGIGDMAAISNVDSRIIKEECDKVSSEGNVVVISNYNSSAQIVISGHKQAVKEVCDRLREQAAKIIPLKVSAPFHCPLMEPAALKLKQELESYKFYDMKYAVISNVNSLPYRNKGQIVDNLTEQMVKPVQWQGTLAYLYGQGIESVIELGPKDILKNLAVQSIPGIAAYSSDKDEDVAKLKKHYDKQIETIRNERDAKRKLITRSLAIVVCTPNNNWNNEEYHQGVVEPYKRVQKIQESIEKEGLEPDEKSISEALNMLKSVFHAKGTPKQEQLERYQQLQNETGMTEFFTDLIQELVS